MFPNSPFGKLGSGMVKLALIKQEKKLSQNSSNFGRLEKMKLKSINPHDQSVVGEVKITTQNLRRFFEI